jgi:hypothetical protein
MATAKEPLSPSSPSLCASGLIGACLDGKVPVARGTVYQLARACAWILARAAGALATSGRPREALGAVLLLARADQDRAGYTVAPASPPGEPHPAATAVWLVEQEAAGAHELVDVVMTTYLSVDLPGRAVVLAQVTAYLLRLADGPGAHATLRSHTTDRKH